MRASPRRADDATVSAAYLSGLTVREVMERTGYRERAVRLALARAGVELRPKKGWTRYDLDESYFASIDAEAKAYWLGFLAADGCMHRSGRQLSLYLADRDGDHVAAFRAAIGFTGPLTRRSLKAPSGTVSHQTGVTVGRAEFCGHLIRHGIVNRKSWSLTPPTASVPAELLRHYWRGHFDGDGSISCGSRWQTHLLGTRPIVDAFVAFVLDHTGLRMGIRRHVNVWDAQIAGVSYPQAVARLLYAGATVALPRKAERVARLLEIVPKRPNRRQAAPRRPAA